MRYRGYVFGVLLAAIVAIVALVLWVANHSITKEVVYGLFIALALAVIFDHRFDD